MPRFWPSIASGFRSRRHSSGACPPGCGVVDWLPGRGVLIAASWLLPRSARVRGAARPAGTGVTGAGAAGVRRLLAVVLVPVVPRGLRLRRRILVLARLLRVGLV